MKQYTHLIWDWNGTLLDDLDVSIEALNQLLIKEGMPIVTDVDAYKRVFQFPVIRYYEHVGFDFEKTPFSVLAQGYMDYYRPHSFACALHEGALDTLKLAKQKGYRQMILSASDLEFLKKQMAMYPIAQYFDDVLGLNHMHADSKASLAKRYVENCGIDPKHILFIGDSVHDYEVASNAGCDCVLLACGHEHVDKLKKCDALLLQDFSELQTYLEKTAMSK